MGKINEISKETVFIDGTKLESCANKYTFVWKKSVGKWEEKMYSNLMVKPVDKFRQVRYNFYGILIY